MLIVERRETKHFNRRKGSRIRVAFAAEKPSMVRWRGTTAPQLRLPRSYTGGLPTGDY
jgi:hypothetical protein